MPGEQQSPELMQQIVVALKSIGDPNAQMQAVSDRSFATLRSELMTHIDSIKQAIEVAHDDLVRVPTDVEKAISALETVITAIIAGDKQFYLDKFEALGDIIEVFKETVNDRFIQNDANTEKAFNAAKLAVNEQNNANDKASVKSENNTREALNQLADNLKTLSQTTETRIQLNKASTDDKFEAYKDRLGALENRITSGESSRNEARSSKTEAGAASSNIGAWIFGGFGVLYAVVASVGIVIELINKR